MIWKRRKAAVLTGRVAGTLAPYPLAACLVQGKVVRARVAPGGAARYRAGVRFQGPDRARVVCAFAFAALRIRATTVAAAKD